MSATKNTNCTVYSTVYCTLVYSVHCTLYSPVYSGLVCACLPVCACAVQPWLIFITGSVRIPTGGTNLTAARHLCGLCEGCCMNLCAGEFFCQVNFLQISDFLTLHTVHEN